MGELTIADRVHGSATLARHQRIARALVRILGKVEATGLASIPADGPTLLAVNHRSMLDGPLVFGMVNRPVACLVKAEAFTAGVGCLLRGAGQISVVRDVIDPAPIRLCLRILQAGGVVGIFPEGTRGDGTARTAKPGVGYFALRTGATVIPIVCWGTAEAVRTPRRLSIRVNAGAALRFDRHPDSRPLNRRLSAAATEQIRGALADLVAATRPGRPTQEFAGRHGG